MDATEQTFDDVVLARSHDVPVVVDFWAEWCGPCHALAPVLESAVAERDGAVELVKVDVDANTGLARQFGVSGIPAVKAFRDGRVVNEFVGALGNSRSGIHLELVAGNGNRFAVFRPNGAPHRVIDVDNRLDVTQQFSDATGSIDLLSRAGLDARTARRVMRFGAQDLAETTERGAYIQQLARIEQNELWSAAEALVIADRRLEVSQVDAQADRKIGLGVHIDAQNAVALLSQRAREIDGGGGLAHAALLIGDGDDPCHQNPPTPSGLPI